MDFNIEIVHLKEELFKELREIESKVLNMFSQKSSQIENNNKSSLEKIELMMMKNEQMFDSINNQKLKLEKIGELESFKNKINDMVIAHEFKIKNISNDLENIKFRYDREIIQNLSVPGFIGPSCQFKTISEYILFNINEINKIKGEKDLTKKENKEIKIKIDSIMKNVFNLVDNSVTRCNEYTDNKQKYFETLLNTKLKEFNEKNMEMKTQALTNQRIMDDEFNKLMKLSDSLMKMKDELSSLVSNKYDELNLNMKDLKTKVDKINNEMKKNNKNYDNLNNTIKKSGLFLGNNMSKNNLKAINNITNNKFQKRLSLININTSHNNTSNSNNIEEKNKKEKEKEKGKEYSVRNIRKNNTIIQKKKSEMNESSKINKTIDKSLKDIKKERKHFNIKDNNSLNKENKEKKENQTKSLYYLKNNINSSQTFYKSILKNKKEINDVHSLEDNISTERKIKNIRKKINKNTDKKNNNKYNNKIITLSDDELNNNKNKVKLNNYFEKIELNKNNINSTLNNKSNNNKSINNLKNKNEIYNLKKYNYLNKNKINPLNSRNNLLKEKYSETTHITEFEENKKINSKINSTTNIIKYQKEPLLIEKKIKNIQYPNEQIINKINKKKDLFQQFLEKHNLKLNNSLDYKIKKKISNNYNHNIISNRMFGTRSSNNYYDYYNETLFNNIYRMNSDNIILKEVSQYDLNKNYNYSQVNTKKNNMKKINLNFKNPENIINFKLITLDNNFKSPKKNYLYKTRNDEELVLPPKNIFKTFQVNKYKNIINNISDDFPTKIVPIFTRTGYSYFNKKEDKKKI